MERRGRSWFGAVALIACVGIVTLSSCGSDNSSDEPDPEATPSPTPTVTATPSPSPSPSPVPPSGTIGSLSVGGRQVCWLDDRGLPRCRAIGPEGAMTSIPVPAIASRQVSTGGGATCGLDQAGLIWCDGPDDPWGLATDYPGGSFDDVGVGSDIACAVRDGTATCWGRTELLREGLPRGITQMTVGGSSVCVLDESDLAACAGSVVSPEPLPPENPFDLLDANGDLNCGVRRSDGGIDCWAARFPARDKEPAGASFVDVAAADAGACALRSDGSLSCAGTSGPPSLDLSTFGPYDEIEGGSGLICGRLTTDALECWTVDSARRVVRVTVD